MARDPTPEQLAQLGSLQPRGVLHPVLVQPGTHVDVGQVTDDLGRTEGPDHDRVEWLAAVSGDAMHGRYVTLATTFRVADGRDVRGLGQHDPATGDLYGAWVLDGSWRPLHEVLGGGRLLGLRRRGVVLDRWVPAVPIEPVEDPLG